MERRARRIASLAIEAVALLLVLACLGASLALIVTVYRRQAMREKAPAVVVVPRPALPPPRPDPPAVVPEDPTPAVVASIAADEAENRRQADRAERRAEGLERARRTANANSARWRRRAMLVRAEVDRLDRQAHRLEAEAEALARERDALIVERNAARADLDRARRRASAASSFAILPYKGTNGTWRRPIPIECGDGRATLMPYGPSYSLTDLASLGGRGSPFAAVLALAIRRYARESSPDGTPVEPYVLFLVRPDGIRPYYEARARLQDQHVPFGYELIDPDWEIDYPELDDPASWGLPAPGGQIAHRGDGSSSTVPTIAPLRTPVPALGAQAGMRGQVDSRPPGGTPTPSPRPFSPPYSAVDGDREEGTPSVTSTPPDPSGRANQEDTSIPPSGDLGRPAPRQGEGWGEGLSNPAQAHSDPQPSRSPSLREKPGPASRLPLLEPTPPSSGLPNLVGLGPVARRPDRPLELVVACGPEGLTIHPGGHRLSLKALDAGGGLLPGRLRAIANARQGAEPGVTLRPEVRFVVEPGGQAAYWSARRQTVLAGLGWPVSLRVAEAEPVRAFGREARR